MQGKQLEFSRLRHFFLERLPSVEDVYLFKGVARENPRDERLFALVEVREATPVRDGAGRLIGVPYFERMALEAFTAVRRAQLKRPGEERWQWNRVTLFVRPPLDPRAAAKSATSRPGCRRMPRVWASRRSSSAATMPDEQRHAWRDGSATITLAAGRGAGPAVLGAVRRAAPHAVRLRPAGGAHAPARPDVSVRNRADDDAGARRRQRRRSRPGSFVELDLDERGRARARRAAATARTPPTSWWACSTNRTATCPEGMTRVALLGDPSREVGSLAEPECRRILGALDLAESMGVPLEWFALSAGAKISMESGTENMDWISRVLRRLIEFTQAGGEVNIIVTGINVGAQPYWNAEATMLMHTRGHPDHDAGRRDGAHRQDGARLLGLGLGGRQHRDRRLRAHHGAERPGAVPGRGTCATPARSCCATTTTRYRDARRAVPAARRDGGPARRGTSAASRTTAWRTGSPTVGDVFSDETNPGASARSTSAGSCSSVCDAGPPAARAVGRDGATPRSPSRGTRTSAGYPVCLIGFESRTVPRFGLVPADGPEQWTSGTLFPMSSKKIARAINAASAQPAAGHPGEPVGFRRVAGVDAPAAARVRRGDWAGGGELQGPDRLRRRVALSRRRLRRLLEDAEREHGGGGPRGQLRVGDRRRPGGGGGVRPRGRRADEEGPPRDGAGGRAEGGGDRRRARRPDGRRWRR